LTETSRAPTSGPVFIRRALEAGIPFSINTDDPGVFLCSLTSELRLVRDAFELTDGELELIGDHALRAAFERPA